MNNIKIDTNNWDPRQPVISKKKSNAITLKNIPKDYS